MPPKVSVIIPCFNQGKYINEAVQSVLHSTFSEFEIIIIDDGSTDNYTKELLFSFSQPKIKLISIENHGVATARNIGIKNSCGEYILPLDADDKISTAYLEEAVAVLDSNPNIKIVCGDIELFGAKKGKLLLPEHSMEMILAQNTIAVSSLFRRSDFDKTQGFNPNMIIGFEDWDFWLSLLENGGEVFKIDKTCFFYRIKRKSRNASFSSEQFSILRKQLYLNHKNLFSKYYIDPCNSFEYCHIKNSKEYKIGKILLKPLRKIL